MNKKILKENIELFVDSFRSGTRFLYVLGYDLLFYLIMVPLFYLFTSILQSKMDSISSMDIMSELSQSSLMNVTAAQQIEIQMFSQAMEGFVYFFLIGAAVLIIAAVLSFTLTRNLIWNYLMKKKFNRKVFYKFNLFNIILLLLVILISFIVILIRMPLTLILSNISVNFAVIVLAILTLVIFTASLYFVYLLYINYVKSSKISKSFSRTFKLIKTNFGKIGISYLFILALMIVVSLFSGLISLLPDMIMKYANYTILLLLLTWMKLYVTDVYKKK